MRTLRLALAAFALTSSLALGQGPPKSEPGDAQGGVLCIWAIHIAMKAVGDVCFPKDNDGFGALLDEAIEKISVFVMENEPTQRDDVEKFKTVQRGLMANRHGLCDRSRNLSALNMYETMRYECRDTDACRARLARALSVPRKPTFSPCL